MKPSVGILLLAVLLHPCLGAEAGTAASVKPSALVQVAPARYVAMTETLTAFGTVEYAPEHSQVLDVQGEGLVSKVLVAVGQRVRKGQPLLVLNATANARTELERARIEVTFARKNLDRLSGLRARQLATNAEVQAAAENLAKAEALLANVQKRGGGEDTRALHATMDGVVEAVSVRQGDIAAAGTPLLRLAKGDRLRVRLGVEAENLPRVQEGQAVNVSPLYPAAEATLGQVQEIYRQIDPKTRLAEVVVPLPVVPNLLPGAIVHGEIVLRDRAEVLAVPRAAVLYQGGKPYVFIAQDGRARLRRVDIGQDDGQHIEVLQGVSAGESVVTLGNYELKDGMALRTEAPR